MNSLKHFGLAASLTLLVVLSGCGGESEPEPSAQDAPPPPPPSAGEIVAEIRDVSDVLYLPWGKNPNAGEAQYKEVTGKIKGVLSKHATNPNLPKAKRDYLSYSDAKIKEHENKLMWGVVKGGIVAYNAVAPESQLYKRLEKEVDMILARPTVGCTGFVEIDGEMHVFVRVNDDGVFHQFQVREGEEFYEDFQLVRIIGDQMGIELLYKPMESTYTVRGPKARRTGTAL